MTVEEVIRNRVVGDAEISAILGQHLFPVHIPDYEYEKPWAMYRVEQSDPETDLDGHVVSVQHAVRLDVLAETYAQAVQLEKLLNAALHTTADDPRPEDPVNAIHFAGSAKSPRDEGFQVEITYTVHAQGSTIFP